MSEHAVFNRNVAGVSNSDVTGGTAEEKGRLNCLCSFWLQ